MSERRAIVFVVAHPDDVAFFMGGTALLLAERYRLHVLCASRGERGYPWTGTGRPPPNEEVARVREQEERECCAMLGASLEFLGLVDGDIYAGRAVVERVAARMRELRPAAVFTHGPQSKPDHAAGSMIALQALQRSGLFWESELYLVMQDAETTHGRYADCYVNISSVVERKRALIACHRSHHTTPDSVEHWIAPNALLGKLAWCEFAEAFQSAHPPMASRWGRRAGSILMDLEA
jgi:LmbE family N-acetylglucosaminyl deacetylase